MLKKRYLFLILIICLFAISAVSATDNATNDIVSAEETTDEVVSVEDNQAILKENNNVGTFTDLVNEIANAGNELNLTMNYTYTDEDSNYKGGISIYKSIVINGNGYTINGNNQARALKIHAPNVVLNNIYFVNSYNIDCGGAIYWEEENGALYNCSFINSTCGAIDWKDISCDGGAVYWYGNNGTVSGCSFVNCSAFGSDSASTGIRYWARGGAISWRGDDGILSDCSFVNSTCCGYYEMQSLYSCEGGAVYWTGKNGVLSSCSFINSFASEETSGAIHWGGVNGILSECSFINSTCGAIYWVGAYGILSDSSFYNCSVDDGCIIFWQGINGLINKSYFSQNFGSISGRSDLKIIKLYSSSLSCENSSFYYNDNVNFSASLNTCGKVIFDIFNEYDIKSFIVNTTNDGIAILSNELNELNAGLWNVTVIYEGNDNYCPSNATATITILPANSSLTIDDVNTTWDQQTTFTANVMSDDKLINDGFVSFYIDDKFIGNASVINGSANLIYELGDAGNHILTAVYNGNNYLSSNNSAKLFVDTGDIEVDDYDSVATFKSLAKLIEETPKGSTLNLIKDYYYVSGSNGGIQINKAITINGQNHTLDGNQVSRILNINANDVILKNLDFINAKIRDTGAAIYLNGENSIMANCDFINCSNWINRKDTYGGGAIYLNGKYSNITHCNFINCSSYRGASIFADDSNNCYMNYCNFYNNLAYSGVVVLSDCFSSNMEFCNFYDNYVDNWAIIAISESENSLISNCNLWSNTGGVITIGEYTSNTTIFNCTFENNVDEGDGACIDVYCNNIDIINCNFTNNTSKNTGGAISLQRDNVNIINCYFINNTAINGGAVRIDYAENSYIFNCTFINNSASLYDSGGAIYAYHHKNSMINKSIFINNTAGHGGSIACYDYDGNILINNSYFYPESGTIHVQDLTLIKINSFLSCNNSYLIYKNILNYNVLLTSSSNPITNKTVVLEINYDEILKKYTLTTNNLGVATLNEEISDLDVGIWNVTVFFEGNDNYYPCNTTATITVLPAISSLTVNDINTTVAHKTALIANVTSNLTINEGYVSFYDNEKFIGESQVRNGIATLIYAPTSDGEHSITAIFNSDNYLTSNATARLFVDSANVEVLVNNGIVGFNSTFIANVKGLYSIINEGNVEFYINDNKIGVVPVVNGSASLTYVPLTAGNYDVKVIYCDSDKFVDAENSTFYAVSKADSEISISDSYVIIANQVMLTADISSSNNLIINEGSITFFDDEIYVGQANVNNGIASLTYTPMSDGEHQIMAIFTGDNYFDSNATAKLFVDSASVEILVNDTTVGFNNTIIVNVNALYSNVSDGTVSFLNFGTSVHLVNGTASFTFVPLAAGDYYIDVEFANSDFSPEYVHTQRAFYHVFKADIKIDINDFDATVGYETTLTVNLSSSNNLTINEGSVEFYIDDSFIGESNVYNGLSSLRFTPQNSGNHKITAVFMGTNNYLDSNNNSKLIVNKASTLISIEDISAEYYSNQVIFTADVSSNSNNVNEGIVKFYVNNGKVGSSNVENGAAALSYVAPNVGNYDLKAVFCESDNYLSSNATISFEVIKMPTTLSGNSVIFDDDDTKTYATVLLDDNNNGVSNKNVEITVIKYSGEYSTFNAVTDSNGISTYDINSLTGGMWYISASFDGDDNYLDSSFIDKFIVVKVETTTDIEEISNPRVNHTYKLKANIHDENGKLVKEGIVQFYLDGVDIGSIDLSKHGSNQKSNNGLLGLSNPMFEYTLGVDDEEAYLEYTPTAAGNFTLFAVYEGTTIYKSSASATDFIVKESWKNTTELITSDVTTVYKGNEELIVTLMDDDAGKAIANADLTVSLNNVNYNLKTDSAGKASLAIPSNLSPKTYAAAISYAGNEAYESSNATAKIVVNKAGTVISASDVSLAYKDPSGELVATIISENGKPLVVNLNIDFNGESYTVRTDSNGQASIPIGTLSPGTYAATVSYKGSGNYKASNATVKVTVTKANTIIFAPDVSLAYKDPSGELVATIINEHGKPLVVNLNVNLNGKDYTVRTDSNGQARIQVGTLSPGKYTATISYKGSGNYKASSTTAKVTVTKAATIIFAPDVSLAYKDPSGELVATIVNEHGKPLVVNLNVELNGKTYTVKTDSNGEARIPVGSLSPGTYSATVSYKGSVNYKASTATAKVTVTKAETIISASDVSFAYKDSGGELVATIVSEHGKPLVVTLNVNLNGKDYSVRTDSNGEAIIPVGTLSPGKYTAIISYKGSVNYKASTTMAKVTVTKADTVISASDVSFAYKDSSGELVATIVSEHGKPLVVTLNVNLNGKDYSVRTDSNGEASIPIGTLTPGTYTATISYKGSANYKASTTTAKVTVTKAGTVITAPDVSVAYGDPNGKLVSTITNEHGKPLVVNLNVELNGKTYKVKSDSNGQISVSTADLAPGTYEAAISYNGSSNYKASSTTANIQVK